MSVKDFEHSFTDSSGEHGKTRLNITHPGEDKPGIVTLTISDNEPEAKRKECLTEYKNLAAMLNRESNVREWHEITINTGDQFGSALAIVITRGLEGEGMARHGSTEALKRHLSAEGHIQSVVENKLPEKEREQAQPITLPPAADPMQVAMAQVLAAEIGDTFAGNGMYRSGERQTPPQERSADQQQPPRVKGGRTV